MLPDVLWVTVVNAAVVALLINSGVVKQIAPAALQRSLREVAPVAGDRVTIGAVRVVAGVELVTAAGLLYPATRIPAAAVVACFGAAFTLLGTAGLVRGSTTACGCFGRASDKPLGVTNIVVGLALLAVLPLNGLVTTASSHDAVVVLLAALGSLLMCLWLNRQLMQHLLFVRRAGTA